MRKPVVATAVGGIPEIVVSGENGLLARTLDEIGDHLRRLRENPALREHLGRGARATAEGFSLKKQIAAYRDLLADIQRERAVSQGFSGGFPNPHSRSRHP